MDSSEEYDDCECEIVEGGEVNAQLMDTKKHGRSEDDTSDDDYPFEVLSTEEIVQHMINCIREVNTVLQLPPTTMRILLNHFGWDKEKLLEAYYERDQEELFKEAKVINPNSNPCQTIIPTTVDEDCEICYLQNPPSAMYGMECGHRFCVQCWNDYLTSKIMEEGLGQTIACAAHNCAILVDDVTVMKLLTDPAVKQKYQHLITNGFVQCNRLMRWCPSADCSNAILVQYKEWRPVVCACGFKLCVQCGHEWHDPIMCSWLNKWLKKCEDDSETSNWISANTKDCPSCNAVIEKNGGCNHMRCKNVNCRAEFCWICLGAWPHAIDTYKCNRFVESEAKDKESYRAALERYLFYWNRYMSQMQSLKFEHKLYAAVQEKMDEMQKYHNMSWIEVQFLKKAVDILCQCRQTLMYTYAFAFYLVKTNQSVIFEDNQSDLEAATEQLSEYLEQDITSDNVADIKMKVQDKYGYCDSRRKVLLEHVYEGYDQDWWVYQNV